MTITQSPTGTSTVTNDPDRTVETSIGTPIGDAPDTSRSPRRGRAILSWVAVGAAVVAAGLLAVNVVASNDDPRQPNLHYGVGDAKDHQGYGPGTPTRQVTNLTTGIGDAKDHQGYGPGTPTRQVTNLTTGIGDAKDHQGYGPGTPTRQVTNLTTGIGDAKDHAG